MPVKASVRIDEGRQYRIDPVPGDDAKITYLKGIFIDQAGYPLGITTNSKGRIRVRDLATNGTTVGEFTVTEVIQHRWPQVTRAIGTRFEGYMISGFQERFSEVVGALVARISLSAPLITVELRRTATVTTTIALLSSAIVGTVSVINPTASLSSAILSAPTVTPVAQGLAPSFTTPAPTVRAISPAVQPVVAKNSQAAALKTTVVAGVPTTQAAITRTAASGELAARSPIVSPTSRVTPASSTLPIRLQSSTIAPQTGLAIDSAELLLSVGNLTPHLGSTAITSSPSLFLSGAIVDPFFGSQPSGLSSAGLQIAVGRPTSVISRSTPTSTQKLNLSSPSVQPVTGFAAGSALIRVSAPILTPTQSDQAISGGGVSSISAPTLDPTVILGATAASSPLHLNVLDATAERRRTVEASNPDALNISVAGVDPISTKVSPTTLAAIAIPGVGVAPTGNRIAPVVASFASLSAATASSQSNQTAIAQPSPLFVGSAGVNPQKNRSAQAIGGFVMASGGSSTASLSLAAIATQVQLLASSGSLNQQLSLVAPTTGGVVLITAANIQQRTLFAPIFLNFW